MEPIWKPPTTFLSTFLTLKLKQNHLYQPSIKTFPLTFFCPPFSQSIHSSSRFLSTFLPIFLPNFTFSVHLSNINPLSIHPIPIPFSPPHHIPQPNSLSLSKKHKYFSTSTKYPPHISNFLVYLLSQFIEIIHQITS